MNCSKIFSLKNVLNVLVIFSVYQNQKAIEEGNTQSSLTITGFIHPKLRMSCSTRIVLKMVYNVVVVLSSRGFGFFRSFFCCLRSILLF